MTKLDELLDASRRRAQELFARSKKEDAERLSKRDRDRRAEDEKIARLRELRLAKEAAESAAKVGGKPRRKG